MIHIIEKNYKVALIITLVIAATIFYVSTLTGYQTEKLCPQFPFKSVAYHFVIFILLGFFFIIYLVRGKRSRKKFIILSLAMGVMYAISDEIHQLFVPGRVFSVTDILVDAAGVIIGNIIYLLVSPSKILSKTSRYNSLGF